MITTWNNSPYLQITESDIGNDDCGYIITADDVGKFCVADETWSGWVSLYRPDQSKPLQHVFDTITDAIIALQMYAFYLEYGETPDQKIENPDGTSYRVTFDDSAQALRANELCGIQFCGLYSDGSLEEFLIDPPQCFPTGNKLKRHRPVSSTIPEEEQQVQNAFCKLEKELDGFAACDEWARVFRWAEDFVF